MPKTLETTGCRLSENDALAISRWLASSPSPDLSDVITLSPLQLSLGMSAPLVLMANASFGVRAHDTTNDGDTPTEEQCSLFGRLQRTYHACLDDGEVVTVTAPSESQRRIFLLSPRMRVGDGTSLVAMVNLARKWKGDIAERIEREIRDDLEREERTAERKNRKKLKKKMQRRRKRMELLSEKHTQEGAVTMDGNEDGSFSASEDEGCTKGHPPVSADTVVAAAEDIHKKMPSYRAVVTGGTDTERSRPDISLHDEISRSPDSHTDVPTPTHLPNAAPPPPLTATERSPFPSHMRNPTPSTYTSPSPHSQIPTPPSSPTVAGLRAENIRLRSLLDRQRRENLEKLQQVQLKAYIAETHAAAESERAKKLEGVLNQWMDGRVGMGMGMGAGDGAWTVKGSDVERFRFQRKMGA